MNLAAPFNPFCSTSNSILSRNPLPLSFSFSLRISPLFYLLCSFHPPATFVTPFLYSGTSFPCWRVTMHVCTMFAHILSHISSRAIILITSNEFHAGYKSVAWNRERGNVSSDSVDQQTIPSPPKPSLPPLVFLPFDEMLLPVLRSVNQPLNHPPPTSFHPTSQCRLFSFAKLALPSRPFL